SLGAPPPLDDASHNARAPEIAPSAVTPTDAIMQSARKLSAPDRMGSQDISQQHSRIDGRSLRKSGRLIPLATRVSPEFDERLRHIAQRDGLLLVEVLEYGLDAYEAARKQLPA